MSELIMGQFHINFPIFQL